MQLLDYDAVEELATIEISGEALEKLHALLQAALGQGTAPAARELEDLNLEFETLMETLHEDEEGTDAF